MVVAGLQGLGRTAWSAPAISVRLEFDRDQVSLDETLQLRIVVESSGSDDVPAPELPEGLDAAFEVLRCVPAVRRVSVNFRPSISRTLTCAVRPLRSGTFEFRSAVKDSARTFRSNAASVEVVGTPATPAGDAADSGKPTVARGDLFLWSTVDKTRAYVGEQIAYRLDLYARRQFMGVSLRTPPTFQEMVTVDLDPEEPHVESVGRTQYLVHPYLRRALFPQRAGQLTIGGAEVEVGLARSSRAASIALEVLPLPGEGQPPGFSPSNVGRYTLAAEVDRTAVGVGEPFTLKLTVEGIGNIDFVELAALPELPGVRRYPPTMTSERTAAAEVGGQRTASFLLIPERGGTITIPAQELSFFDPAAARYETVTTDPIEIEVTGDAAAAPVTDSDDAQRATERLEAVITGERLPRNVPADRWLTDERWMWAMLGVPAVATAVVAGEGLYRRFGPDEYSRTLARARSRQRTWIHTAEQGVGSGEGFYSALASLLQERAVDRSGPAGVGLPRPALLELLDQRGVSAEDRETLADLLDRCDAARYGADGQTPKERQTLLDRALRLVHNSTLARGGPA